ncbi:MAG: zf-HC2 domain-containing protein, partial [Planctomycetota bacterium]
MTCIANNELLEYLDNEIDANLCREIELHLKGCAECRDESESLKEAQTLWRNTLSPHGLTSDFHIRVKNRLSRTVFRRRVLGLAMAGAAAVWMLIVILVVINSSGKNLPVPQEPTTSGNEIASRADKQTVAVEQPITVTPITDAIAIQTEKDHFHILHKKHPMLSILVKMVRRQVSTGDNTGVKEVTAELTKLLVDTDDEIRAIAAASLGELHATGSIPELVKLLND